MFPNLFVVGAPKAGTTTLFDIFKECDDIYTPKEKEIHFFSKSMVAGSYYSPSVPNTDKEYLSLYSDAGGEKYLLDCSPSYLYSDNAIKMVRECGPSKKVVIMLRDPVERSVSHYCMDLAKGHVEAPLKDILANPEGYPQHYYQYVELSMYEKYVSSWVETVGENNVFLIFMEDMRSSPQTVLGELGIFLGIALGDSRKNSKASNSAFVPRYRFVVWMRQNKRIFKFYHSMPEWLKRLVGTITTKPMKRRPVDIYEESMLSEILESSVSYYCSLKG